jgi:glutaredoxin 3
MYCTRFCPYCISAERLLVAKGVAITKLAVDQNMELWREMEQLTGRDTVPQIFVPARTSRSTRYPARTGIECRENPMRRRR